MMLLDRKYAIKTYHTEGELIASFDEYVLSFLWGCFGTNETDNKMYLNQNQIKKQMCQEISGSRMAEIQNMGEYTHLHTEFKREPYWIALTYKRGNWRWFYTDNILQVGTHVPRANWPEKVHEKGKNCIVSTVTDIWEPWNCTGKPKLLAACMRGKNFSTLRFYYIEKKFHCNTIFVKMLRGCLRGWKARLGYAVSN